MARLTVPAVTPLRAAIWSGSLADTFCVRLLSIAQQRQAAATSSGPARPPHSSRPCHASRAPPAPIALIPPTTPPHARTHSPPAHNPHHSQRYPAVHVFPEDDPGQESGGHALEVEEEG